mmetsp:Transcript_3139/g.3739  ORF Transcript_3139/g.3739 Transcript_3139/m.3739 type:complete len:306 (+) Transcript_3139:206-1123(+)
MEEITLQDRIRLKEVEALRVRIKSKPRQSNFCVAAIVVYKDLKTGEEKTLEGVNDEPCYMGGSLCAERAALLQLRLLPLTPDDVKVSSVYITSDAETYITPGMLCREYMISNIFMDESTPIIMSGAGMFEPKKQLLGTLYPFPSLYHRMTSHEAVKCHECLKLQLPQSETEAFQVYEIARAAALKDDRTVHPISFGAAVMFEDGHIISAYQKKALEYGCTLDAVGQLAQGIADYANAKPKLLAQVDNFGVAHAPFAPGRAFFEENGYGTCRVLLHNPDENDVASFSIVDAKALAPSKPNIVIDIS